MCLVEKPVQSMVYGQAPVRKQTSRTVVAKVGQLSGTFKRKFSTLVGNNYCRRSDFHASEPICNEGVTVGVWLLRLITTDWRLTCVST